MNTSSQVSNTSAGSDSCCTSPHSHTSSRVIPARQPDSTGGVIARPSTTTNTLLPVPSHGSPTRLANSASEHPSPSPRPRPRHCHAYEVVFRPTRGDRSLRGHGANATEVVSGHGPPGCTVTASVAGPGPRSLPSGPGPDVYVTRIRAYSRSASALARIVAATASATSRLSGTSNPRPRRRTLQPGDVARQGERGAVGVLHRLEHTVTDGHSVIQQGRRPARRPGAVSRYHAVMADCELMDSASQAHSPIGSTSRAFSSVSPHSAFTSLPHVMPAWYQPQCPSRDPERADSHSEFRSAFDIDPAERPAVELTRAPARAPR